MLLPPGWQRQWLSSHCRRGIRRLTTLSHDLSRPVQSYLSTSPDPYLNLSIEHHLLQKTSLSSTVLFLYTNRPCVVIGRNQNPWTEVDLRLLRTFRSSPPLGDTTDERTAQHGLDLVRRRSGGGTVFHDFGNVNWSVICPASDFTRDKHAEMVVRALRRLGVARCRVNERHDVVLDLGGEGRKWGPEEDTHVTPWTGGETRKVSGSAYKLTRGRALHHGTALLQSGNLGEMGKLLSAPGRGVIESRGVESVSSKVANIGVETGTFGTEVQREFWRMYGGEDQPVKVGKDWLDDEEVRKGYDELRSLDWTYCQTPRFSISNMQVAQGESRGMPLLKMSVRAGVVEELSIGGGQVKGESVLLSERERFKVHEVEDWQTLLESRVAASGVREARVEETAGWTAEMLPSGTQLIRLSEDQ
ncbi:hypothetical protein CAC42_7381 [Sphaceloma murrayae]|uniref:Putative lipoate-protein ligase A n=1 Tax=Sphaceloma murrayae TaxID=2082308 RepID=A0A2K1QWW5_9PEZI|nr:hypothetical protein CAC42_7381 [Sphaceloma murrayae]